MRSVLAISATVLLVGGSSASGSSTALSGTDPVWSPDGKRIALVGSRDRELYVMNRDGSGLRRLTHDGRSKQGIAWSPDGKWIAYTAAPATIEAISPDGRRRRHLADCCANQPDFSPVAGHRIAFVTRTPARSVSVMDLRGLRRMTVAAPSEDEALISPTWSPGGQRIAFAVGTREHGEGVTPHLGIVSRHGGRRSKFLVGHSIWSTDWSPDGRYILIVETTSRDERRISVLNLRTQRIRSLRPTSDRFWARWSPDGREILFADQGRIFVMASDGSHVRALVPRR